MVQPVAVMAMWPDIRLAFLHEVVGIAPADTLRVLGPKARASSECLFHGQSNSLWRPCDSVAIGNVNHVAGFLASASRHKPQPLSNESNQGRPWGAICNFNHGNDLAVPLRLLLSEDSS